MAADFAPRGIRVNAISPGEIDTPILSPGTETIVAAIPMGRLGTPEEVAKAIYFLCTEQSSYINGAELHIMAASTCKQKKSPPVKRARVGAGGVENEIGLSGPVGARGDERHAEERT